MTRKNRQQKIAIFLAIAMLIQIPLLFLYMIRFLNSLVIPALFGCLISFTIGSIFLSIIYFYKPPKTEDHNKGLALQNIFKSLDNAWFRKQVETHLIFGPISKYIKLSWLLITLIIGYFFFALIRTNNSFLHFSFSYFKTWWIALFILFTFSPIPKYRQAVLGWFICKGACLIIVLFFVLAGILGSREDSQSALLFLIILLVIWLPFEFIPKITLHQKYITLARIILTYVLFTL